MKPYTTLEHWSLRHGSGSDQIPASIGFQLARVAKTSVFGEGKVLEDRQTELRTLGVVGVIAAGDSCLEILPKIAEQGRDGGYKTATIRKRLVQILAVVFDLRIETGQITELEWQNETLLEILIRIFCDKLTEAVRRGMPRNYVVHEEDLPALRGTLVVQRQFTQHAVNPSRLACRFDDLSSNTALNQVMKAAVSHLSRFTSSTRNLQRLRELEFVLVDISTIPVSALPWGDIKIDRTNNSWQDLLGMARMFLRDQFQNTNAGEGVGTALLFEMNMLFEKYIGRLALRASAETEFRVSLQGGRKYCLAATQNYREAFLTKPDILIRDAEGRPIHIVDTKWKIITPVALDSKMGVAQSDVYQMIAYAQLYKVPSLTLLYPLPEVGRNDGLLETFIVNGDDRKEIKLQIVTIDLAVRDQTSIIKFLRKLISDELQHCCADV